MGKWRQKGVVQDSDDEEEESQESLHPRQDASLQQRVERVDDIAKQEQESTPAPEYGQRPNADEEEREDVAIDSVEVAGEQSICSPPSTRYSPKRPTASPITPTRTYDFLRGEPTESPDPLQSSQTPVSHRRGARQPSCIGGSLDFNSSSLPLAQQRYNDVAVPSQIVSEPSLQLHPPPAHGAGRAGKVHNILAEFGITPLSDASDDEVLSDPPTDMESPDMTPVAPHPHRRTAVQVVIPLSTALQRQIQEQDSGREFRQRKPIQLHPYALEGEIYRREVQSRGLKPVRRPRSPERRIGHPDAETQEKDFDPNDALTSSPPELEIPVSTPIGRRPRMDVPKRSSITRRVSDPTRRRLSATQLQIPHAAKKRKLNLPLTQAAAASTNIFESEIIGPDFWSIPPNSPPNSSSSLLEEDQGALRLDRVPTNAQAPNLPTPSTSSIFQDDPQPLPDSDSDPITRSAQRLSSSLRRPARVVVSDSSTSASQASSEAEQSDNELRRVGKRIKGVLPASWLRFDQQAQVRRKARAQERERAHIYAAQSPEPSEPQRGVAQRIMKRTGNVRQASIQTPSQDIVVITDESDNEGQHPIYSHVRDTHHSVEDAAALAAAFDTRYADLELDTMENDRLHLFTLGGTGSKRKKQTRITDGFHKEKKFKRSDGTGKSTYPAPLRKKMHKSSRKARRTPPPALSVIDLDFTPSRHRRDIPQFIRLAKRQALQRPDLARQSPRQKQIRLHNVHDTEVANETLQQWRQGLLKRKTHIPSQRHKTEQTPLAKNVDNQQHKEKATEVARKSIEEIDSLSDMGTDTHSRHGRVSTPTGLQLFRRTPTQMSKISKHTKKTVKPTRILQRSTGNLPCPLRIGQLEGDEFRFSGGHRKIAFEKGLRHADYQPMAQVHNHPYMNPQMARFLSDDDALLPPLPSANDIGEHEEEKIENEACQPRQRLIRRKVEARRVDVDAREYRQPSEPGVQGILNLQAVVAGRNEASRLNQTVLQGLGPYGTRYPTTFDVAPLQPGTYFHALSFLGSEDLRRALSTGRLDGRSLDMVTGYCIVNHYGKMVKCGSWNDETSTGLQDMSKDILKPLTDESYKLDGDMAMCGQPLTDFARFLRSLINYVSSHLSFSDRVDRKGFVIRMQQLVFSSFDQVSVLHAATSHNPCALGSHSCVRVMTYLLVLSVQTSQIALDPVVDLSLQTELIHLTRGIATAIVTHVVRSGVSELVDFLEQNKRYAVRQDGIQESDTLIESVVVCMHALEKMMLPGSGFWDIVTRELSTTTMVATHIQMFETAWATIFTLLPFVEIDSVGIPDRGRLDSFSGDNWSCISTMLRRISDLYPSTHRVNSSSLNEYVRANLVRCHRLIKQWHWQRPEQLLNAVFDFFGKNGLKQLRREVNSGSVSFLDDLASEQSLALDPSDGSFHIALKCLALGLRGMNDIYPEKKIRSFVFRTIPNHGRIYPKDQPLDEESLAALRNHHDLLCTLYWAASTPCRPKLDLIRGLVSHETSHREACRVNVRAWANLTAFQLSIDEPYASAQPFALWHKDIMHQTLKQYRLAKTEADDYLRSGILDGTTDVSAALVRQTMERNQEQVIATLRDCIHGMKRAFRHVKHGTLLDQFVVDCDIVHLLELPHLEDRRLISVIRDTLAVLRDFTASRKTRLRTGISQKTDEESQDYGDFPDIDDLDDIGFQSPGDVQPQPSLGFIQTPLWHLLSNAFGAEVSPDDNLLMECIDTWILIADSQVGSGERSWSYYIDPFSQVSWQQLRQTEQTRKFGPYFLAALAELNSTAYEVHRHDYTFALLLSLVDRESMLRFQHRLLHAILRVDQYHPLMTNLPFYQSHQTGEWDINADTVRSRRLALISSIMSNMRDHIHTVTQENPTHISEVRGMYATILKEFMNRMKSNYKQLQQGATVTGAYVEFVQKVVQFLQQYTCDICPVLPFFTDSVAFPLPATDPTYVVARLCGYAPKAADPGTTKQLSVFIQTVAQQAAMDNQQVYLVSQLTTALCSGEAPAADRATLRSLLLQSIFPAYLEAAFSSRVSFLIARPILQSLRPILHTMIFDLRVTQPANLTAVVGSIVAVSHAFIRGTEQSKGHPHLLQQPHILSALAYMFEAMDIVNQLLEYICDRTMTATSRAKPVLVTYTEQLGAYIGDMLHNIMSSTSPSYRGDAHAAPVSPSSALLSFCRKGLEDSMKANWSESQGSIWFGQGHARREILFDSGTVKEERMRLLASIEVFHPAPVSVYRDDKAFGEGSGGIGCDVVV
jgi:hypothetical protein